MPDDVVVDPTPVADPNEGVTPAAQREVAVEPKGAAPADQRPGIAAIWAAEKEAGTGNGEPEDDGGEAEGEGEKTPAPKADETPAPSAEDLARLEGRTEDELKRLATVSKEDLEKVAAAEVAAEPTDAEKAKIALDKLLSSFDDPAVLNAALERAGVDKIAELPAVKALVGRQVQGARDSTKAEILKAQATAAQLADVTAEGRAAKGKLIAALDQLASDIEEGKDEGLTIPTAEAIGEAFEEYAGSAVGEYHTKAWNVLSDQIYSTPEMGGPVPEGVKTQPPAFTPEQMELLNAVKGANPSVWLQAHIAVQRDQLWRWAQAEAAADGQGSFENDKILLQSAHAKEIKELEKARADAVKTARDEARAEALADIATGKLPPKTPKSATPATLGKDGDDDGIPAGASMSEIRRIVKAKQGQTTAEV